MKVYPRNLYSWLFGWGRALREITLALLLFLVLKQGTPLLVEKVGVAPDVTNQWLHKMNLGPIKKF